MSARRRAEIMLHIDNSSATPLYQQVYEQVRDAILAGSLTAGDKLTSIRKLSADLSISHTTVEQAYLQLATEGLVANVPRSGYVVYMCNISKVLSPSLRIAYMVLPPALLARFWDRFNSAHPNISWLDQEVLARFIAEGHWDSHVRKTAKGNHLRHDKLMRCLQSEFGSALTISGTDTGMHLYVTVNTDMTQQELLASAMEQGVKVYGTARMWFSKPAPENNIMIGFSAIAKDDIAPGIAALRRAWLG